MRPLTLELFGIGPFVTNQKIDFESLDDRSLFLIHGPTGQGKTFLFDAICYALYTETPAGREGNLKSDFLPDGVEPFVDFRFRLGPDAYRVRRTLRYERPKSRGEGTTGAPETQFLIKLMPDGTDGEVLAEKKTEVNTRLKSLLGLEAGQFRQVVMIPQGDFRDLLLSKSEDREILLENLFDTERYKNIQLRLKEMEDEANLEESSTAYLRDQKMQDLADLWRAEDLSPSLFEAADSEILEPFETRLQSAYTELKDKADGLSRQDAELSKLRDKAVSDHEKARALYEDHRRLADLETQLAGMEAQSESMSQLGTRIETSRRALSLKDRYEELRNAGKMAGEADRLFSEAESRLVSLKEQKADLDTRAADTVNNQKRVSSLDRRIRLTESLRDEGLRRRNLQEQLTQTEKHLESALVSRQNWQERQNKATLKQGAMEKERDTLVAGRPPEGYQQRIHQLENLLAKSAEHSDLLASIEAEKKGLSAASDRQKEAGRVWEELKIRREAEMAGELASELVEGKPCPVCGALDHPNPAGTENAPTTIELESAEKNYLETNAAISRAQNTVENELKRAGNLKGEIQTLEAALNDETQAIPQRILELKAQIERESLIQREWDSLLNSEIPGLSAESEQLSIQTGQYDRDIKNLRTNIQELETRWELAMSGWPDDSSDTPPSPEELPRILDAWIAEKARLEKQLADFTDLERSLIESLREAETTLTLRNENRQSSTESLKTRELAFTSLLKESDFPDEPALEKAISMAGTLEEDTRALDSWESGKKDLSSRIQELRVGISGRLKPDLKESEERQLKASEAASESSSMSTATAGSLKRHSDIQAELLAMEDVYRSRERRNGLLRKLSEQVRGNRPPKISLNRFFLARRLEEVLIQATRRLSLLSRGRFTLKRRDEGRTAGARAGLDLLISDAWTGTERPVNTLSGGQLFMASLSLALGLADVVQARSGGMKLEALFIDEGFGTLDDEALQGVLQVLNDLRENRMVGVISHVPELKRQISDRIEVFRSDPGSSVRLVCGS